MKMKIPEKHGCYFFNFVGGSSVMFGGGVFVDSVELARLSNNRNVRTQRQLT